MPASIKIFTDGACSGNPGPGGWGAIVSSAGRVTELGGGTARTTNNRMEMLAAIEALRFVAGVGEPVQVYADSTYVIQGISSWLAGWRRRGWKKQDGSEVLNRDLWEALDAAVLGAGRVSWHYVRGHAGTPGNHRCDEIAVAYSKGHPIALYEGDAASYGVDLTAANAASGRPFYLSLVSGVVERHATWSACEARVKGRRGVKFKKVSSDAEEASVRKAWGLPPSAG